MKQILALISFMFFSLITYSQTQEKEASQKYILKISPTIKFSFATSKKARNNNYYLTNFITGLDLNFLTKDKKNNYHDAGVIIGFIPNLSKRKDVKTFYGNQIGVEYSYRMVYLIKKNPNIGIFTAFGTQILYTKTEGQTFDYYGSKNTSKSFEQNFVITPGIQYTKNKFFFDFSVPTSIRYTHLSKRFTTYDNQISVSFNQNYNLFNWNIGFKASVGIKF